MTKLQWNKISRFLVIFLCFALLNYNGMIALANTNSNEEGDMNGIDGSEYIDYVGSDYIDYERPDVRSSMSIRKSLTDDRDTPLYHVVAAKNFVVTNVFLFGGKEEDIHVRKGDLLLLFDIPEFRKTNKAAIVVGENADVTPINRSFLQVDKKGNLIQSPAIDTKKTSCIIINTDKYNGNAKYIYEKQDIRSKKIGVMRKGMVLASEFCDIGKSNFAFYSLLMPGGTTGYVVSGPAKNGSQTSWDVTDFVHES